MYKPPNAPNSDVLSLRISAERLENLKREANSRKLSLNVLANHILDAYFDFALPAKNVGFLALPKKTVREMIASLSDAQLSRLAQGPMKSEFVNLIYMMRGRLTPQSFFNTILAWARDSNFTYRDNFDDDIRILTIHHDMGKKWSVLLSESIEAMLRDISSEVNLDIRDDVIVLRVK